MKSCPKRIEYGLMLAFPAANLGARSNEKNKETSKGHARRPAVRISEKCVGRTDSGCSATRSGRQTCGTPLSFK